MRPRGIAPFKAGILAIIVIAVASYFAFSREFPIRSDYEIEAVFHTANNVKERQPVRIAGVDVGEVVAVEHPDPGSSRALIRRSRRGACRSTATPGSRSARGCSSRATGSSSSSRAPPPAASSRAGT